MITTHTQLRRFINFTAFLQNCLSSINKIIAHKVQSTRMTLTTYFRIAIAAQKFRLCELNASFTRSNVKLCFPFVLKKESLKGRKIK